YSCGWRELEGGWWRPRKGAFRRGEDERANLGCLGCVPGPGGGLPGAWVGLAWATAAWARTGGDPGAARGSGGTGHGGDGVDAARLPGDGCHRIWAWGRCAGDGVAGGGCRRDRGAGGHRTAADAERGVICRGSVPGG